MNTQPSPSESNPRKSESYIHFHLISSMLTSLIILCCNAFYNAFLRINSMQMREQGVVQLVSNPASHSVGQGSIMGMSLFLYVWALLGFSPLGWGDGKKKKKKASKWVMNFFTHFQAKSLFFLFFFVKINVNWKTWVGRLLNSLCLHKLDTP